MVVGIVSTEIKELEGKMQNGFVEVNTQFGKTSMKTSPLKKLCLTRGQPGAIGTKKMTAATTASVLKLAMNKARFRWRASKVSRLFNCVPPYLIIGALVAV